METVAQVQIPQTGSVFTTSTHHILGDQTDRVPLGVRHVCVAAISVGVPSAIVVSWLQLAAGQPPTGKLSRHNCTAFEELCPAQLIAGVVALWRRRMKSLATVQGDGQRWTNFINAAERRSLKLHG